MRELLRGSGIVILRLGKSILSPEVQERAYRRGIGRLTLEERQEAARKGFMSPESVRKRTETMRSRLEEEKERRSQASSRVQRGRWDSMSEGERKTIAARISWGLKKYYEGLSGKERDMISRERSEHMQKFWASLPEDERAVFGWNGDESRLRNRQSCERGPTEPELFLGMYLEKYFPGKWAYNGDGNQNVVVGRRTPDFVRLDGKKQVIEVLGGLGWWHFEEGVEGKIERYKKYGYDCIVVLGYDCYLKEELDKAILEGSTDPIEIRDVTELRSSEVTVGLAGLREKGLVAEEEAEPIEL